MAERAMPQNDDEFFVGYMNAPTGVSRFVRTLSIAWIVLIIGLGILIAAMQQSPGDGTWNAADWQTHTGLLIAEPYPMLRVLDDGEAHTYLLVESVKMGAQARIGSLDGKIVDVRAALIQRDNRRMLELAPDDDAITPTRITPTPSTHAPQPEQLGTFTGRGEIVDSKCYLGVMKPGEGKPHKACASLCIRGGIPPMLVTRPAPGTATYLLLCTKDGKRLPDTVLPFVADPVEVTGELEQWDDLLILKIDVADIRRR